MMPATSHSSGWVNITVTDTEQQNQILIMWCQDGVEVAYDYTECTKQAAWARLKDQKYVWPFDLNLMKLRARVNSQRHYEIYLFNADPGETVSYILEVMQNDPQPLVDRIRQIGEQIYSDRQITNRPRII